MEANPKSGSLDTCKFLPFSFFLWTFLTPVWFHTSVYLPCVVSLQIGNCSGEASSYFSSLELSAENCSVSSHWWLFIYNTIKLNSYITFAVKIASNVFFFQFITWIYTRTDYVHFFLVRIMFLQPSNVLVI